MNVWLYSSSGPLHALTREKGGANLPDNLGPWRKIRCVRLRREARDEQEAIALVSEHGYCCFD